jgi:hypothetical protein
MIPSRRSSVRRSAVALCAALSLGGPAAAQAAAAPPDVSRVVSVADVERVTGKSRAQLARSSGLTLEQVERFTVGAAAVSGFRAKDIGYILVQRPSLIPGIAVEVSNAWCLTPWYELDECTIPEEHEVVPSHRIGEFDTADPEVETAIETPDAVAQPTLEQLGIGDDAGRFAFMLRMTAGPSNAEVSGRGRSSLKSLLGSTIAYVEVAVEWGVDILDRRVNGHGIYFGDAVVTTGGELAQWRIEDDYHAPETDRCSSYRGKRCGGRSIWRRARFKQTLPLLPDPHRTVNVRLYPHYDLTCTGCNRGVLLSALGRA